MRKLLVLVLFLLLVGGTLAYFLFRRKPLPTPLGWKAHVTTLAGDGAPVRNPQQIGVVGVGERLRRPGLVPGHAYAVESNANSFTVASAGADGKFDKQTWSAGGKLQSFDEDAVATNEGSWLFRHWAMK